MGRRAFALGLVVVAAAGCADPQLDPAPNLIHARFDPEAKSIPMPNDAVRDATRGMLDLPNDTDEERARLTAAEQEFYAYLETLDGWSSLMSATVELTGPIDPKSIDEGNLQVWHWTSSPTLAPDVRVHVSDDGQKITLDPPKEGWIRGDRYVVMMRGGVHGVRGLQGERVECDAAFYFLRQTERLDTPEHERAFPGDTREERQRNAAKLEAIRQDLAPVFDRFERDGIPRSEVASLWAFTVTTRTELAMDKASQRMPLPINLMLDPKTGHVHVDPVPWDRPFEAAAKRRLSDFKGFGLSADLLFGFTAPMNVLTVNETTVRLYKLGGAAPVQVPATVTMLDDAMHVAVAPNEGRLAEATSYMLVVDDGVRDLEGKQVSVMPAGHFLTARTAVFDGTASQVGAVPAADAEKLERSRAQIETAIDQVGRDRVLAAWPFTTMEVKAPLVEARKSAERLGVDPDPVVVERKSPSAAVADFPLGLSSLTNVADVYYGTLASPYFLDARTTARRDDGGHEVQQVAWTMTVPKDISGPVPVVIFGHGLVTERRFALAIAGAMASRGFATVTIDFPFHGTRTYCAKGGPVSVIDPTSGEPMSLAPCKSGTTCNDYGKCVDASGQGNHLAMFPVIDLPVASGAKFLDINDIAASKDHFTQALVDLGALDRSLRSGNWEAILGAPVDRNRIYYTGQSLGGIMGGIFLGTSPDISRAVLNVPGADLLRMFAGSGFFKSHLDGLFQREGIEKGTYDSARLLAVGGWIMDAVDPQHLGREAGNRSLLIQMATLDFIIPNESTKELEQVTGARRMDYIAEHGFIVIPFEPEFLRGVYDMAQWLNGEEL